MEEHIPKYTEILSNLMLEFVFVDFRENATVFHLFAQPFSIDVDTVSEELHMELLELQSDLELQNKFRDIL